MLFGVCCLTMYKYKYKLIKFLFYSDNANLLCYMLYVISKYDQSNL